MKAVIREEPFMNMRKIYRKAAKIWCQRQVPFKGEIPDPDELIRYASEQLKIDR